MVGLSTHTADAITDLCVEEPAAEGQRFGDYHQGFINPATVKPCPKHGKVEVAISLSTAF